MMLVISWTLASWVWLLQGNVEEGSVKDLDDDHHADQSESSDGHQGVEESDSSEDEVCSSFGFFGFVS